MDTTRFFTHIDRLSLWEFITEIIVHKLYASACPRHYDHTVLHPPPETLKHNNLLYTVI